MTQRQHPLPQVGERVRMAGVMADDPAPMAVGDTGTVTAVHADVGQIHVEWDNGRSLILLTHDPFEVVNP